jgi:hypothetical protein
MWKGDYINLGAGAECGIYRSGFIGDLIQIDGEPIHYDVDRDYVLPMTLKLSLNGVEVYDWQPDEPQWWITGFNPAFKGAQEDDLTVEVTIDFSEHPDLWEAFYAKYYKEEDENPEWLFYPNEMKALRIWGTTQGDVE